MCQWMPAFSPACALPPPVLISSCAWRGVLVSSYAKWLKTFSCAPQNFSGQWHCSHVCCAGRRFLTGVGIGRGNLFETTAESGCARDGFERTSQLAPGPTWQPTQPTRACGESLYAVYSGVIGVWHVAPQNWSESV